MRTMFSLWLNTREYSVNDTGKIKIRADEGIKVLLFTMVAVECNATMAVCLTLETQLVNERVLPAPLCLV